MTSGTPMMKAADIRHEWHVVDAADQVLGRVATRVAKLLSGKHRAHWVPYLDTGDFVVVLNAAKVKLTGRKSDQKVYHRHTGYPGGLKSIGARDVQAATPERMIEDAVRGMLPHTKMGRKQFKKLKVYRGDKHPHEAQKPKTLSIESRRGPSRTQTKAQTQAPTQEPA